VQVTGSPLVVTDARVHPLLHNNGGVIESGVIAYAGVPLVTSEGVLGAFCAIDTQPREWSELDLDVLRTLAAQVSKECQMRTAARRLEEEVETLRHQEADRVKQARYTIHDLRTPVSAMIMSMDLLAADPLTAEQSEFLELAQTTGTLLLEMIGNLLGPGESGAGLLLHAGSYEAPDLMERAVNQVRPLATNKHISLSMNAASGLPKLHGDGEKILRILVNLLGNAVKFTPDRGRIRLEGRLAKGAFEFSVEDSGCGVPPEEAEHIFLPGVKLDKTSSHLDSTGLGLAFCKDTVQAHGGRIWVESVPGRGCRYLFTIPV
jgi:signal transduction histidine kinase